MIHFFQVRDIVYMYHRLHMQASGKSALAKYRSENVKLFYSPQNRPIHKRTGKPSGYTFITSIFFQIILNFNLTEINITRITTYQCSTAGKTLFTA